MSSTIKFVGTESSEPGFSRAPGLPVIKVIGLGGGGGNAVNYMHASHIKGVEYICANTDAQALASSPVETRIQLGGSGLGAGANPERGREATREHIEEIKHALQDADMVFITAGMGGGTGTGSAPVVAEAAREMGILTVGVVSQPFSFERGRRNKVAVEGIEELREHVDSLICIPNDKLMKVLGEDFNLNDAFAHANEVLYDAVNGITEIVTVPGIINVDFEDLRTVMSERGNAMMGMGSASGDERAVKATQRAIANPLLEDIQINGARGILANISSANTLSIGEFHKVGAELDRLIGGDDSTTVIIGTSIDETLGDEVRVMVVATGLDAEGASKADPAKVELNTQAVAKVVEPQTQSVPVQAPAQQAPMAAAESPAMEQVVMPTMQQAQEHMQAHGMMHASQPQTQAVQQEAASSMSQAVVQPVEASMQQAVTTATQQVMSNSTNAAQAQTQAVQQDVAMKRAVGENYPGAATTDKNSEAWLDIPAFLRRQVD